MENNKPDVLRKQFSLLNIISNTNKDHTNKLEPLHIYNYKQSL